MSSNCICLRSDLSTDLPQALPQTNVNPRPADVYNLLSPTARHRTPQLPLFEHDRLTTPTSLRLKVGDFVELKHVNPSPAYSRKGDFFCIHYIIEDATTEVVTLRGLLLKRNNEAGDLLPKKLNELYLLVNVCEDDDRSAYEQNLVTVKLEDVVQKRKVNVTNSQYPSCTFRDHGLIDCSTEERRRTASRCFELACRWTHISYYKHKKDMQERRPRLSVLRTLKEGEANTRHTTPDTVLAASHLHPREADGTTYTLFDSFCGLGGVSVGARQAGVRPTVAFDYDFAATSTYTLNQPDTLIFTEAVSDMVQRADTMPINIDILHLSPPCQPFSRAHTREGQNDESNQATLFSIHTLLAKLRPRIVTVEEAEWLVRHHKQWWTSVVHMFTDHGYSVTWKILNCRDYGIAQNRERVILLASCPGTSLPEIPPPTHGPAGTAGLKRYVTIADTLRDLSRHPHATHNETTGMYAPKVRSWPAYDANTFAWCITTGGSDGRPGTYHPSGKRDFTIRELACLQGFPPDFEFAAGLTPTQCRRQIGNAVPPVLAKVVFKAVREALEREDARVGRV